MKIIFPLVAAMTAVGISGCLTSTPPSVRSWPMECTLKRVERAQPKFGVARLSYVQVRAPYDSKDIVVLRNDGSVAFDPLNEHAAMPSLLIKSVVSDALNASGLFQQIVGTSSIVSAQHSVEVDCRKLALDCTADESASAIAEVGVRIVSDRQTVSLSGGEGKCEVVGGNIGEAFSKALSNALSVALDGVK